MWYQSLLGMLCMPCLIACPFGLTNYCADEDFSVKFTEDCLSQFMLLILSFRTGTSQLSELQNKIHLENFQANINIS